MNRTYPDSCCAADIAEQISISRRPLASAVVYRSEDLDETASNRNFSDISDMWSLITAPSSSSSSIVSGGNGSGSGGGGGGVSSSSSSFSSGSSTSAMSSSSSLGVRSSSSRGGGGGESGGVRTIMACRAVYPQVSSNSRINARGKGKSMFSLNSITGFGEQGRESKQIWIRMSTLAALTKAGMWKSGYHFDRKKPQQKCTVLFVVQGILLTGYQCNGTMNR